jgi:predicted AlkP superfamily pyrophosphatase or phosphodiesterase
MKHIPKLLIVQAAALGYDLVQQYGTDLVEGLTFQRLLPAFPAVTCTAQACFRTAAVPSEHGMIANGFFDSALHRVCFWEQSASLVAGPRIWTRFRHAGGTVAMLCWQQSLGEAVDLVLSPAPIHKHGGGMVDDCYSQPDALYAWLCRQAGRRFRLRDYWGPFASARASAWIAEATCGLLGHPDRAPDLCLTYLPALDYDLQRYGPCGSRTDRALSELARELAALRDACARNGYEMIVFGDYAIAGVRQPVYPNQVLRHHGFLRTRHVGGRQYADLHTARAFAVVDHEIAHIYVRDPEDSGSVQALLEQAQGIDYVLNEAGMRTAHVDHARAGRLTAVAAEGYWMAYPWWDRAADAPDYASHVDIHNKPGFDPCELFLGWPPGSITRNPARVRGSHGRAGEGRATAWAATCPLPAEPRDLRDLALAVARMLEEQT